MLNPGIKIRRGVAEQVIALCRPAITVAQWEDA
jgi:hypothetical protein